MHIKKIKIKNILSYKDASFVFDNYNVIVGTNNAGKTNLIRILDKMVSQNDFSYLGLNNDLKFEKKIPSEIMFTLELSDEEAKMIFQVIFGKHVKQTSFKEDLKKIDVLIHWSDIVKVEPSPNLILYRFHSGLTIIVRDNENIVFDYNLVFNDEDDFNKTINEFKTLQSFNTLKKNFSNIKNLHTSDIGHSREFCESFYKGESLDIHLQKDQALTTTLPIEIRCNHNNPTIEGNQVAEFFKLDKNSSHNVTLSRALCSTLSKNYVKIVEIHPSYDVLISNLVQLRNTYPEDYEELQKVFENLTNGLKIRVSNRNPQNEITENEHILIKDDKKTFSIQESASGHYALIHVLYSILNKPNQLVMIDEPEVHFHPIMITQLNDRLNDMAIERNNQIIIISHSPKFVNYDLLDSNQKSRLISVRREDGHSNVNSSSESYNPTLKRHLFNPEIFFGNCTMIVEGSDDYFAMKAISDYYGGIFEKYSICLTHCWGKNNVTPVIDIHNEYKIPYTAMVDSDYNGSMDNVVKLPIRLEEEYQKLGWTGGDKVKDDAYPFMENLLKNNGLSKLKQTTIWIAFEKIVNQASGKIPTST